MKKLFLLLATVSLIFFSCKKEKIVTNTVTNTVTDTIKTVHTVTVTNTTTVTITDTVFVSTNPPALIGLWNLVKYTQSQNGIITQTLNNQGTWLFNSSTLTQTISGTSYTYPIIYNTGYVVVNYGIANYEYDYTWNGTQYVLVKTTISGGVTKIDTYYFHK